jgi:hypothetical protein
LIVFRHTSFRSPPPPPPPPPPPFLYSTIHYYLLFVAYSLSLSVFAWSSMFCLIPFPYCSFLSPLHEKSSSSVPTILFISFFGHLSILLFPQVLYLAVSSFRCNPFSVLLLFTRRAVQSSRLRLEK